MLTRTTWTYKRKEVQRDLYSQNCHALYLKGTGQQVGQVLNRVIMWVKRIHPKMKCSVYATDRRRCPVDWQRTVKSQEDCFVLVHCTLYIIRMNGAGCLCSHSLTQPVSLSSLYIKCIIINSHNARQRPMSILFRKSHAAELWSVTASQPRVTD